MCSSSGGQIVLYSLWYHHTERSEWSKITEIIKIIKIQFYNYEHVVVQSMCEFFDITYYKHVMTCRVYIFHLPYISVNTTYKFVFTATCFDLTSHLQAYL